MSERELYGSRVALEAIESGLRHRLVESCVDHRLTLFTYFSSSEEQEFMRDRLHDYETRLRGTLKLEELEDVERQMRFDILFDAEVQWEGLTGRLETESFALSTRRLVYDLENKQYLRLAIDVCRQREYVHRCEIMADGLRPGFIREQKAMIQDAWTTLTDAMLDECFEREDACRRGIEEVPALFLLHQSREQFEELESIERAVHIERPFDRTLETTRRVRDEFAKFWMQRVVEFHRHMAVDEQELYRETLLVEEEDRTRELCLIPSVVGGLEDMWRDESVHRPEGEQRWQTEMVEIQEREVVWRVSFPVRQEMQRRERLMLQAEHHRVAASQLVPEWRAAFDELVENFATLIRMALVSQRFALESVAVGARRGVLLSWSGAVFKTAINSLVQREDTLRYEAEDPCFDAADLFRIEAGELHSRHELVLVPEVEDRYSAIYFKALVDEEYHVRDYIVNVEWDNGIVFLYASFHRLWLETVTMGVTRNALRREWERDTLCMHEVWVRLGIASGQAFALDSDAAALVEELMPDFDTQAAPPDEIENGKRVPRKKREKDPNALPSVFYIGEDPFGAGGDGGGGNGDGDAEDQQQQRRGGVRVPQPPPPPPPPQIYSNSPTPGIVVRYRNAPVVQTGFESSTTTTTTRRGGAAGLLSSMFESPTLAAAAGSVFISPDSFDVTSIRATLKELARIRGYTFMLITQFFQITRRSMIVGRYNEWLDNYGDMGYWAHAIEVGLLDQLHNLDDNLCQETAKTQSRALQRASKQIEEADDDLCTFVNSRNNKSGRRKEQQQQPNNTNSPPRSPRQPSPPKKKRTVIDALKESLRQPPRPSQRKLKPVNFTVHPDVMCPDPKVSYSEWSPSRVTPDEFALLEHNIALRASGVEARGNKRQLPLDKKNDPAWAIYMHQVSASRASDHGANKSPTSPPAAASSSSRRHSPAAIANSNNNLLSPTSESRQQRPASGAGGGGRTSKVRFAADKKKRKDGDDDHQDEDDQDEEVSPTMMAAATSSPARMIAAPPSASRPVSAASSRPATAEIPRLSSRCDDYSLPGTYRHVPASPLTHLSATRSTQYRAYGSAGGTPRAGSYDPNIESRPLQFGDIMTDDDNNNGSAAAQQQQQKTKNHNPSPQVYNAYAKVLRRTQHNQTAMGASTADFIQSSMRSIPLIVKPPAPQHNKRRG